MSKERVGNKFDILLEKNSQTISGFTYDISCIIVHRNISCKLQRFPTCSSLPEVDKIKASSKLYTAHIPTAR